MSGLFSAIEGLQSFQNWAWSTVCPLLKYGENEHFVLYKKRKVKCKNTHTFVFYPFGMTIFATVGESR
jgi:hypothetical protein